MSTLLAFFKALPELLQLVAMLEAGIKQAGVDRKVSDDVKTLHEAFSENNPEKLNALFNR